MKRPLPFALSLLLSALSAACGDATNTEAAGTSESAGAGAGAQGGSAPTYSEDIAPMFAAHCGSCHVAGGIAPFPLDTYEQVSQVAALIKIKTQAREMPPWNPDNSGDCNTFGNARWLTDAQIATIAAWADAGAPEGDPALPPPAAGKAAALPEVSKTVSMDATYTPDANEADDYRCFLVDPGVTADTYLTGYDVKPGDARVVHHALLFALDSEAAEQDAAAKDAAEPGPGYTCFGGAGVQSSRMVIAWAPGGGATVYPSGTGLKLSAGRKAVLQIHYNLQNGAVPDRTRVDLLLSASVEREASLTPIVTTNIDLPPGKANVEVSDDITVPATKDITVWAVVPHMHTRGRTLRLEAESGGATTCLVDVPSWNFHWQSMAVYAKPVAVAGGSTLHLRCGYDTSHETENVTWGEGTGDEMCINFLYVTR